MATRGARALRAAVVTVMVTGLLAVAQPAQAQAPNVQLASISNVELKVGGGTQTVQIQVRNQANGDPETDTARGVTLTMQVPLGDFGVGIVSAEVINGSGCSTSGNPPNFMQCPIGDLGPGETRTIAAHLAVDPSSPLPAGESRNGEAVVQLGTGERQKFNIRLQGPDQAPSITRISGVVTDQATGEPIDGANVLLIDGAGAEHRRGTDSQGRFDIRPEPDRPIAPGRIAMVAEKTGYQGQQYQHEVPLRAGDSVTDVHLVMINQQVQESPTPEPTESPAPEPTASPTPAAAPVEDEGESGGGLTFFTKVMIIIGVLLVLLGVGAIALLIWRRRRDEGEDDGGFDDADDPVSGPSGPTPTPGSRGVYRPSPTQVAGAGAATQVIPRAGAPASGLPAVGPSPALAQTSLMGTGATPSDATTVLPRADDPTQVGGAFGDERTRVMRSDGGFGEERTTVMRPDGGFGEERTTVMRPDDATQLIGSPGAGPGGRGRPTSGAPAEPPAGAAPASGPSVGSAPGAPSAPRRAAPQPPTYNGAPEQPYGYEQGGPPLPVRRAQPSGAARRRLRRADQPVRLRHRAAWRRRLRAGDARQRVRSRPVRPAVCRLPRLRHRLLLPRRLRHRAVPGLRSRRLRQRVCGRLRRPRGPGWPRVPGRRLLRRLRRAGQRLWPARRGSLRFAAHRRRLRPVERRWLRPAERRGATVRPAPARATATPGRATTTPAPAVVTRGPARAAATRRRPPVATSRTTTTRRVGHGRAIPARIAGGQNTDLNPSPSPRRRWVRNPVPRPR